MQSRGSSEESQSIKMPTLLSPIGEHAAYVYEEYYRKPYDLSSPQKKQIERPIHGIQHAARVALWAHIFIAFYDAYDDYLPREIDRSLQVKLIQIAALFHDTGRKGDGVDYWDKESAENLYRYLNKLEVKPEQAKLLAEAIANKDAFPDKKNSTTQYIVLKDVNGKVIWDKTIRTGLDRSIYQKIIHDSDCLDILRIRESYQLKYLDFIQEYFFEKQVDSSLTDMALITREVNLFIIAQGDSMTDMMTDKKNSPQGEPIQHNQIKQAYNTNDAYNKMIAYLEANQQTYPVLFHYYKNQSIFNYRKYFGLDNDKFDIYSEQHLNASLLDGTLFARSFAVPTGYAHKEGIHKPLELCSAFEMRKTHRRIGKQTQTKKLDINNNPLNITKEGNPNRSLGGPLGWGAGLYVRYGYCSGYFVQLPKESDQIRSVHHKNIVSGNGKKKADRIVPTSQTKINNQEKLDELTTKSKLNIETSSEPQPHAEILADITEYGPAFFTFDKSSRSAQMHPHAPVLLAIHLHKEREKHYPGSNQIDNTMVIYEYSHKFTTLKKHKFQNKDLIRMWSEMAHDYLKQLISKEVGIIQFVQLSEKKIKVYSLYNEKSIQFMQKHKVISKDDPEPADCYYDDETKRAISDEIKSQHSNILVSYLEYAFQCLKDETPDPTKDEVKKKLLSLRELSTEDKEKIFTMIQLQSSSHTNISKISNDLQDLLKSEVTVVSDKETSKDATDIKTQAHNLFKSYCTEASAAWNPQIHSATKSCPTATPKQREIADKCITLIEKAATSKEIEAIIADAINWNQNGPDSDFTQALIAFSQEKRPMQHLPNAAVKVSSK